MRSNWICPTPRDKGNKYNTIIQLRPMATIMTLLSSDSIWIIITIIGRGKRSEGLSPTSAILVKLCRCGRVTRSPAWQPPQEWLKPYRWTRVRGLQSKLMMVKDKLTSKTVKFNPTSKSIRTRWPKSKLTLHRLRRTSLRVRRSMGLDNNYTCIIRLADAHFRLKRDKVLEVYALEPTQVW